MPRLFRSYIPVLGLLIVLSISALVSIRNTFLFSVSKEWLSNSDGLPKRQNTITFTIPWDGKPLVVHDDLQASIASSSSLSTQYSSYNNRPYDFLPSTTTTSDLNPTSSTSDTFVSTPNPTSAQVSDFDCTDTGLTTASFCPDCELSKIETGLPEMLGYIPPTQSMVPSSSVTLGLPSMSYNFTADTVSFVTPMGYICRPQLITTQNPLGCSYMTVTETWHSTDYSCIATSISSVAEITMTVTVTPSSSLTVQLSTSAAPVTSTYNNGTIFYSPCPSESSSASVQSPPLPTFSFSNSTPSLHNLFPNLRSDSIVITTTSTHPCPNAGYSCSECPDGWFCPPAQTPAVTCPCGFGWACANCVGGWFCVPGPTSTILSAFTGALSTLNHSVSVHVTPSVLTDITITQTSGPPLSIPIPWPAFTPTISILGGVVPSPLTSIATSTNAANPIFPNVFSAVEHIKTETTSNSPIRFNSPAGGLSNTVPSIPSVTSGTVSIITTPIPVAPLILPQVSGSGFRKIKRRASQWDENRVS